MTPKLTWRDGTPIADAFDDVYFHAADGLAETRHVFLDGNRLTERFRTANNTVIAETGFGTGLNFLAAWQLFRAIAPAHARLHFVTLEAFPLDVAALITAHAAFPELAELSELLCAAYPAPMPLSHRLLFDDGRVILDLHIGEAAEVLSGTSMTVDAWFLDGFAPSKNPEMWRQQVLDLIAHRTKPGGSLATFTAAGAVRRGLQSAGFQVEKRPGFGHKRDMVIGAKPQESQARDALPAWAARTSSQTRRIAIIGGGIAGCAMAEALHRRGLEPVLFERRDRLAAEASGNYAGLVKPLLTPDNAPSARFYGAAFLYLLRYLEQHGDAAGFRQTGILDLPGTEREAKKFNKLPACGLWPESLVRGVDQAEASDVFGLPTTTGGVLFPQAGALRPGCLAARLADGVDVRLNANGHVVQTEGWLVDGEPFDTVILATGIGVLTSPFGAWLTDILHPVRGQTTRMAANATSRAIRMPLHQAGYILPEMDGAHVFGATFLPRRTDSEIRAEDHQSNQAQLSGYLPDLFDGQHPVDGHAALRACTPDHLPLIGPMIDITAFKARFDPQPDAMDRPGSDPFDSVAGLYCLSGLGSRGILGAPLAAEILASEICGDPLPIRKDLVTALRPARFAHRALKRRQWVESWDQ